MTGKICFLIGVSTKVRDETRMKLKRKTRLMNIDERAGEGNKTSMTMKMTSRTRMKIRAKIRIETMMEVKIKVRMRMKMKIEARLRLKMMKKMTIYVCCIVILMVAVNNERYIRWRRLCTKGRG